MNTKGMWKRCLSVFVAGILFITTPLASCSLFETIGIEKTSKAYIGNPSSDVKMVDCIADSALQNYILKIANDNGSNATLASLTLVEMNTYIGKEADGLKIPSSVKDIKGLGYVRSMKSLDISACSSVTSIDDNEFNECMELKSVKLPESITVIGEGAFQNCEALENINLNKVKTIKGNAFSGCKKLNDASYATMQDELDDLGTSVFGGCASLTEAKVPVIKNAERAKTVPSGLFSNCQNLEKVEFCDGNISTISSSAFSGTGDLRFKVNGGSYETALPDTIKDIQQSGFFNSGVKNIDLSKTGITEIKESVFGRADLSGEDGITLPSGLKTIGKQAFASSNIKVMKMPESVDKLEEKCFYMAKKLKELELSPNIEVIPVGAFQKIEEGQSGSIDCTLEVSITGGKSSKITDIEDNAFNASLLGSNDFIYGLKKLKNIGDAAFSFCGLTDFVIPANVEKLGSKAFMGNYMLKNVKFEKGSKVTVLPDRCFGNDFQKQDKVHYALEMLESVVLPENLEEIGEYCFGYAGYRDFRDLGGEREIGSFSTIGYGSKVENGKAQFPESLATVGKGAFAYCTGLRDVILPDRMTSLPEKAFYNAGVYPLNDSGNEITGREELKNRFDEDGSFESIGFTGLKSIHLPDALIEIGNQAFEGCYNLHTFTDASGADKEGAFPDNLKTIGNYSFSKCFDLEKVVFDSNLESIGDSAFENASLDCENYKTTLDNNTSVYLKYWGLSSAVFTNANKLESIGKRAFKDTNVGMISLPEQVEVLPDEVFENCTNLTTVTMSKRVTSIGANAFTNDVSLQSVKAPFSASWVKTLFNGVAGDKAGQISVLSHESNVNVNTYIDQENKMVFNCLDNFDVKDVSLNLLELNDKGEASATDLLTSDSNQYIKAEREAGTNTIKVFGKKLGDVKVRVVANVTLKDSSSTHLKEAAQLPIVLTQEYTISVKNNPVTSLELSSEKMSADGSIYLSAKDTSTREVSGIFEPLNTTDDLVWSIANSEIVQLGENTKSEYKKEDGTKAGMVKTTVKALKPGHTVLTLKANDSVSKKADIYVRVPAKYTKLYMVGDEERSSVGMDLSATKELKLKLEYDEEDKTNADSYPDVYTFSSSNESILKVTQDTNDKEKATLRAYDVGEAVITAKSLVTGATASITVTVERNYKPDALSVKISESEKTMYVGEKFGLTASVLPIDADQKVKWSSSDEEKAVVDQNGMVTAISKGEAVIKAETENGRSVSCRIKVNVKGESIKLSETTYSLQNGDYFNLSASVLPAEAEQKFTWESSNENVAKVDSGGRVTAVALGTAVIKVTSSEGFVATCEVSVFAKIEKLTMSATESSLAVGNTMKLTCAVAPAEADQRITWSSADEAIAKVDESGTVTALRAGTVNIIAKAANGDTAKCYLTVYSPSKGLKIKAPSGSTKVVYVAKGSTVQLGKYYSNKDNTDDTFKYTAKKNKKGKVTAGGSVTAKKKGSFKVKLTSYYKSQKTASASITVKVLKKAKKVKKVSKISGKSKVGVGNRIQLTAVLKPASGTTSYSWYTSNSSVASVDSYGVVSGISKGKVTITVTTSNGKKKKKKITVG